MKPLGSVLAFTRERNAALLRAYRKQVGSARFIRLDEIGERVVNSPAERFWVSEERAAVVVSAMMRGKPVLDNMRPQSGRCSRKYTAVSWLSKSSTPIGVSEIWLTLSSIPPRRSSI